MQSVRARPIVIEKRSVGWIAIAEGIKGKVTIGREERTRFTDGDPQYPDDVR